MFTSCDWKLKAKEIGTGLSRRFAVVEVRTWATAANKEPKMRLDSRHKNFPKSIQLQKTGKN